MLPSPFSQVGSIPLLDDPKKNLSRCRQPAKILFALRDSGWEKTPKFSIWAAKFSTTELLSGKVKPATINTYISRELNRLDVDEIPILIQKFGIVRIHEKNGDILEKTMFDNLPLFHHLFEHITVADNVKHLLALARVRYLRCGIDGGRGSNDPAYWLDVCEKLDRPPSGQLTPKKLEAFTQSVREELVTAHAASLKADKQLLFVIGENHLSSVSWLYEQVLLDLATEFKIEQLLVELNRELLDEALEYGKVVSKGRIANWMTGDWINSSGRDKGLQLIPIDTKHGSYSIDERDSAMANSIDDREGNVKAIASIAIVGHLHVPGLEQKIGDRFHTHFVTCYTTDDLNSDYILPQYMRNAYEKL